MKYTTPAAFRTALLEHLRAERARIGVSPEQLRKRVVFERLLARLLTVAPSRWVLKGGIGLGFRHPGPLRTTLDLDLLGPNDSGLLMEDLVAAQLVALDDHFEFTIVRSTEAPQGPSVRFHITTEIGGLRFDEAVMDVEGHAVDESPPESIPSHLLAFAEVPPVTIPILPLAVQIAEKVHAYTRAYGRERQRGSTRPKDLVDLLLIITQFRLDATRLREALARVFRRRGTHPLPLTLPPPPAGWELAFSRHAAEMGMPMTLEDAYARVAACLNPVLQDPASGQWDPSRAVWDER